MNSLNDFLVELRHIAKGLSLDDARGVVQELVGKDIKVRNEPLCDGSSRFILTSERNYADFNRELVRACNGLVLEYPEWNVLAVPSPMFNPHFKRSVVAKNIAKYKIFEIHDGTIVTLYWYKDKWCMSTTNGYDVSGLQWVGPRTYSEAFAEVCQAFPEFSLDNLDRECSYTVGFRHPDFHPFAADPAYAWLVHACDLREVNSETPVVNLSTPLVGLPHQRRVKCGTRGPLLDKMFHMNKQAVNSFMTAKTTRPIHYGYVLRAKGLPQGAALYENIILESELLRLIRMYMYNVPKSYPCELTAANRRQYMVLRAYLSGSRAVFLALFPQYSQQYYEYDVMFSRLCNRVGWFLRNKTSKPEASDEMTAKIDLVAVDMASRVEQYSKINVLDVHGPSLIQDFIIDKKYTDIYYSQLLCE